MAKADTRINARSDLSVPRDRTLRPHRSRRPDRVGRTFERVAYVFGTPSFLAAMVLFIVGWIVINTLTPARFDPYTFTFLTLLLSIQASLSSPLILLSQSRQSDRDRVQYAQDRVQADRNLADTEYLAREIVDLRLLTKELLAEVRDLRSSLKQPDLPLSDAGTGFRRPARETLRFPTCQSARAARTGLSTTMIP